MSLDLFRHINLWEPRFAVPRPILLVLDFDGTVAPLVDEPRCAAMLPQIRASLLELESRAAVVICVLSGRSLDDLRARVGLSNVICIGNHGLEGEGPGLRFMHRRARQLSTHVHQAAEELRRLLADVRGAFVEDKGLTACVHFRRVRPDDVFEVAEQTTNVVRAHQGALWARPGRKNIDLLPLTGWSKGAAVRWLRRRLGPDYLPVCIGDDITDEDAFRVLADGITVRVDPTQATAARYHVRDPEDLAWFLDWLVNRTSTTVGRAPACPSYRASSRLSPTGS